MLLSTLPYCCQKLPVLVARQLFEFRAENHFTTRAGTMHKQNLRIRSPPAEIADQRHPGNRDCRKARWNSVT